MGYIHGIYLYISLKYIKKMAICAKISGVELFCEIEKFWTDGIDKNFHINNTLF